MLDHNTTTHNTDATTATAAEPKTLADKALLVRLKMSQFSPYVTDKGVTAQVERDTGVVQAGRYNKHLLKDSSAYKKVREAYNAVYQYHTKHTAPWLDEGVRMLPVEQYYEYTQQMKALIQEADDAVRELGRQWPAVVDHDVDRLGDLGDIDDYPQDIVDKFNIEVRYQPVPHDSDWRVSIDEADRQSLRDSIAEAQNNVTRHVLKELMEPVRYLAQRLHEYQGDKGQRWRNSPLENVQELVHRLPALNINGDPEIDQLIYEVGRAVKGIDAQDVKQSSSTRKAVKSDLENVMDKMEGLF